MYKNWWKTTKKYVHELSHEYVKRRKCGGSRFGPTLSYTIVVGLSHQKPNSFGIVFPSMRHIGFQLSTIHLHYTTITIFLMLFYCDVNHRDSIESTFLMPVCVALLLDIFSSDNFYANSKTEKEWGLSREYQMSGIRSCLTI